MPSYKMNSMSGLSVLKKPFSWKFGYPRFQKKVKVHLLEKAAGAKDGVDEFPWEEVLEELTEAPHAVTNFSWDFARHERVDRADTLPDLGVDLTHSSAYSASSASTNSSHCAEDDSDDAASVASSGGSAAKDEKDPKDLNWDQFDPDTAYYSSVISRRSSPSLPATTCKSFEDADDGLGDEDPVYANCLDDEPLYENFSLSGPLGALGHYSNFPADEHLEYSDDEEHIYEHVHLPGGHRDGHHHPVNVFLALLQGSAPISPDPNIYEVPPGAIRSTSSFFEDCGSGRNITPPSGFQDYEKLSWVRAAGSIRSRGSFYDDLSDDGHSHYLRVDTLRDAVVSAAAQDEEDRHKLPVEVIYSTIVKPRRKKKQRPAISAMLQIAAAMQKQQDIVSVADVAVEDVTVNVVRVGEPEQQVHLAEYPQTDVNDNFIVVVDGAKLPQQILSVTQPQEEVAKSAEETTIFVGGLETEPKDLVVLTALPGEKAEELIQDDAGRDLVIVTPPTPPVVSDDEDAEDSVGVTEIVIEVPATVTTEEVVEVIEIGSDGRWDTKELPPTQLDEAKQEQKELLDADPCFQDCPAEVAKLKHAAMAFGSQFYVNGVNSKPQQPQRTVVIVNGDIQDADDGSSSPTPKTNGGNNIGSQIMRLYEEDRQKVRDSLNLPDVSLLDMDESMEDIERERRRVIENQTVRAKRISSWIKSSETTIEQVEEEDQWVKSSETANEQAVKEDHWVKSSETATEQAQEVDRLIKSSETATEQAEEVGQWIESTETATVHAETEDHWIKSSEGATDRADQHVQLVNEDGEFPKLANKPPFRPNREVVYDSILLNKQKTKSYWEQLMMAAAVPSPPLSPAGSAAPLAPACQVAAVVPQGRGDLPSLEQAGSEVSEQEFFDARSTVSPPEPADALGAEGSVAVLAGLSGLAGPKVVETVAKACRRLEREGRDAREGESVVERDIRLQREREEQVAREREAALDLLRDDGFVSIPTDEGNCSEYGSEEKELSIDGSNSRVMSPDVGALPHHHHHQRTQSMDSTSSGHSSGSGSGSGNSAFNGRRRVTVKPLAEPEDPDSTAFIRPTSNETPIEREIRLAREREAELAREQALRLGVSAPAAQDQTVVVNGTSNKSPVIAASTVVDVVESRESVRNATNRIQQEISRANEREQELRHVKEGPQRFSTPDRVQMKRAVSTSQLSTIALSDAQTPPSPQPQQTPVVARPSLRRLVSTTTISTSTPASRPSQGRTVATSPTTTPPPAVGLTLGSAGLRRFAPNPSQKGLMQRFLASRGKMSPAGLVTNGVSSGSGSVSHPPVQPLTSPPAPTPSSMVHVPLSAVVTAKIAAMVDARDEREEPTPAPVRRGYTSAEDKIQEELKEMRRREEELRLQRARTFARSQPNLLSLLDDVDSPDSTTLNESSPVIDKLPAMAALRSALSNPNLLDEEAHHNGVDAMNEKNSQKNVGIRKKNALIAEWENRIQQHIEH